jgi:hypothetical protein
MMATGGMTGNMLKVVAPSINATLANLDKLYPGWEEPVKYPISRKEQQPPKWRAIVLVIIVLGMVLMHVFTYFRDSMPLDVALIYICYCGLYVAVQCRLEAAGRDERPVSILLVVTLALVVKWFVSIILFAFETVDDGRSWLSQRVDDAYQARYTFLKCIIPAACYTGADILHFASQKALSKQELQVLYSVRVPILAVFLEYRLSKESRLCEVVRSHDDNERCMYR